MSLQLYCYSLPVPNAFDVHLSLHVLVFGQFLKCSLNMFRSLYDLFVFFVVATLSGTVILAADNPTYSVSMISLNDQQTCETKSSSQFGNRASTEASY